MQRNNGQELVLRNLFQRMIGLTQEKLNGTISPADELNAVIHHHNQLVTLHKRNDHPDCLEVLKTIENKLKTLCSKVESLQNQSSKAHVREMVVESLRACNYINRLVFFVFNAKSEYEMKSGLYLPIIQKNNQLSSQCLPFLNTVELQKIGNQARRTSLLLTAKINAKNNALDDALENLNELRGFLEAEPKTNEINMDYEAYYCLSAHIYAQSGNIKKARKAIALAENTVRKLKQNNSVPSWLSLREAYNLLAIRCMKVENYSEAIHYYQASKSYLNYIATVIKAEEQIKKLNNSNDQMIQICLAKLDEKEKVKLEEKAELFTAHFDDAKIEHIPLENHNRKLKFKNKSLFELISNLLTDLKAQFSIEGGLNVILDIKSINYEKFKKAFDERLHASSDNKKTEEPASNANTQPEVTTNSQNKPTKVKPEKETAEAKVKIKTRPEKTNAEPVVVAQPQMSNEIKWNNKKYKHVQPNNEDYYRIYRRNKNRKMAAIISSDVDAQLDKISSKKVRNVARDGRKMESGNSKNCQGFVFFKEDNVIKKKKKRNMGYQCKLKIFGAHGQGNIRILGSKVAEGEKYKNGKPTGKVVELYEFSKVEKGHRR